MKLQYYMLSDPSRIFPPSLPMPVSNKTSVELRRAPRAGESPFSAAKSCSVSGVAIRRTRRCCTGLSHGLGAARCARVRISAVAGRHAFRRPPHLHRNSRPPAASTPFQRGAGSPWSYPGPSHTPTSQAPELGRSGPSISPVSLAGAGAPMRPLPVNDADVTRISFDLTTLSSTCFSLTWMGFPLSFFDFPEIKKKPPE